MRNPLLLLNLCVCRTGGQLRRDDARQHLGPVRTHARRAKQNWATDLLLHYWDCSVQRCLAVNACKCRLQQLHLRLVLPSQRVCFVQCIGDGRPGFAGAFTVRPWVAEGRDPGKLANAYLIEYCNNEDTFGTTAVRPGGFLSQLDSQSLLTYDVITTLLRSPRLRFLLLMTMTLACGRILPRPAVTRTWICWRSATQGCGLPRRCHHCAPRATQPKALATASAQMDRPARGVASALMPTARWRTKTTDGSGRMLGRAPSRGIHCRAGPSTARSSAPLRSSHLRLSSAT